MTIKREDIKKLVIQQMLQESVQEEGAVTNWLRSKISSGAQAGGEKLAKFGQKMAPKPEEDPEFLKDLSKIADFIQMFRNSQTVTDSDFYKKFVMGMQEQVNEQYESQFLKQILSKKPTITDVEDFVKSISSSPALHKNLKSLELKKVEVPNTPSAPTQTTQTAATSAKKEPEQEVSVPAISGSPEKRQLADRQFLEKMVTDLKAYKKANTERRKVILKNIIKTLADMIEQDKQSSDEPLAQAASAGPSLEEVIIQEIYNSLIGKNK